MAITTTNGKLAMMEWCEIWEPSLPMAPGVIDPADQQQFLWDFPEISWTPATSVGALLMDVNTRVRKYLSALYSAAETSDLTTLWIRRMNELTGDMTARFLKVIQDSL